MATRTVNISFQKNLLAKIDKLARQESCSRSELLGEAARLYVQHQTRWKAIFALGDRVSRKHALTTQDVDVEIKARRAR